MRYSMVYCGGFVRYRYGDGELEFDYSTLTEVGQPYRQWFINEIKQRGWIVDRGIQIDRSPWVVDILSSVVGYGCGHVDTSY